MTAPDHPNLFDAQAAEAARDAGIALLEVHHGAQVEQLVGAIAVVARALPEITADHVHVYLVSKGIPEPTKPNAWGAAFRKAALAELIEDTGRAVKSARPSAHARRIPVWRSRLFAALARQQEIAS